MRARGSNRLTLAAALIVGCSSPSALENASTARGATVDDPEASCEKPCDKYRGITVTPSPYSPEHFVNRLPKDRLGNTDYVFQDFTLSVCADSAGMVAGAERKRGDSPSQPGNQVRLKPGTRIVRYGDFYLTIEATPESLPIFVRTVEENKDANGIFRFVIKGTDAIIQGDYTLRSIPDGIFSGWLKPSTAIRVRPESEFEYKFTTSKSGEITSSASQLLAGIKLFSGKVDPAEP